MFLYIIPLRYGLRCLEKWRDDMDSRVICNTAIIELFSLYTWKMVSFLFRQSPFYFLAIQLFYISLCPGKLLSSIRKHICEKYRKSPIIWVQMLALPFISYMIIGKFCNFSELQFSFLKNRDINVLVSSTVPDT